MIFGEDVVGLLETYLRNKTCVFVFVAESSPIWKKIFEIEKTRLLYFKKIFDTTEVIL